MKEENIKIISDQDSLELDCLLIKPNKEIKAIVEIAHGMNEHKERYIDFMKFLAKNGYASFIHDHRGHGKSIKNINDLGYFYDDNASYVVEDLHQINEYLKNKFKDKKIILFGHSMGSMIVRKYISKYAHTIDGLIVCGSPSKNNASKLGLKVVKLLKSIKGERYRSEFVKKLMFGGFDKKGSEPNSWVCHNKEILKLYNEDELCKYTYTLNGYENIIKLMIDIYNPKIYNRNNLDLPIYFIAGNDDPVIKSKKDFNEAINFLKKIGYHNIDNTLYDDMSHEILNEVNNNLVYDDILNWLNKII